MNEEVLIEIATHQSFSTLIHKSHTLSGWVIALIVQSIHTSSCPGAIKSLNESTLPTPLFAFIRTCMSG